MNNITSTIATHETLNGPGWEAKFVDGQLTYLRAADKMLWVDEVRKICEAISAIGKTRGPAVPSWWPR